MHENFLTKSYDANKPHPIKNAAYMYVHKDIKHGLLRTRVKIWSSAVPEGQNNVGSADVSSDSFSLALMHSHSFSH